MLYTADLTASCKRDKAPDAHAIKDAGIVVYKAISADAISHHGAAGSYVDGVFNDGLLLD